MGMNVEENKMHILEEEQEKSEFEEIDEEENLAEDLIRRKQKINQFNVEGNEALNQTNIQTLNLKVNYTIKQEKEAVNKEVKKIYNLRKKDDCIKFVEKYKNSDYLAMAIILCVFEALFPCPCSPHARRPRRPAFCKPQKYAQKPPGRRRPPAARQGCFPQSARASDR